MLLWLQPLSLLCLVQRATALAQATASNIVHLTDHEVGGRTAPHNSVYVNTNAEVSGLAEVGLHARQVPLSQQSVITWSDQVVFGSFMLLTINPPFFASNPDVAKAAQAAVRFVTTQASLSVVELNASLATSEDFPAAVRVDFWVAFANPKHRQTFIQNVAADNCENIFRSINDRVPPPYWGKCRMPDAEPASLLEAAITARSPKKDFGTVVLEGVSDPLSMVSSSEWREAVAMAISNVAQVFRLEVGTLMSVASTSSVTVDFWLMLRWPARRKVAIKRVEGHGDTVLDTARWISDSMKVSDRDPDALVVSSRVVLQVPTPGRFTGNTAAKQALDKAVALVAASPGLKGSQLSASNISVVLATMGSATDSVRVGFQVSFDSFTDRQEFVWDFAMDGGRKLASIVGELAPSPFKDNCRLPGADRWQARSLQLGSVYGDLKFRVASRPRLASDPLVQDAMAMAVSEMASVHHSQVGILMHPTLTGHLKVMYWVASLNMTFRQVALERMTGGMMVFLRRTLVQLDNLDPRDRTTKLMHGSATLQVNDARTFANSISVREALARAVAQAAMVRNQQVQGVDVVAGLWQGAAQTVRVDFQVAFANESARKAFTSSMAVDGGNALAKRMSEQVPAPFKGTCRLPEVPQTQVNSPARRRKLDQPFGTILLNLFEPEVFVQDADNWEAMARTIAKVASVSRPQVGVAMSVKSASVVSVDYWVLSTDAVLRQAAVALVEQQWSNGDLKIFGGRTGLAKGPVFTACGGTVACCPAAGAEYRC